VTIAATEQPAPITNELSVPVLPCVLARLADRNDALLVDDLQARAKLGLQRYGTLLMTHNGRDALADLYQELLDALMYLTQYEVECDEPIFQDFLELKRIAIHVKQRLVEEE